MPNSAEGLKDFKWGDRIILNKSVSDFKAYKSFTYRGVQYSLYDCVYMYRDGANETDVGKIIKLWETKQRKRAKVLWFFRPVDICNFLQDYKASWNELFLASGEGTGLSNIIPLGAIIGQCNVICTSKDSRNISAYKSDIGKADYIFSHVFDVGCRSISDKLPDTIESVKVERLLNWNTGKTKAEVQRQTVVTTGTVSAQNPDTKVNPKDSILKEEILMNSEDFEHRPPENHPLKKRKFEPKTEADSADLMQPKEESPTEILNPLAARRTITPKKEHADDLSVYQSSAVGDSDSPAKCAVDKANGPSFANSDRPMDSRRWVCKLPWEENLLAANEERRLVSLINLDPSYTSSDVQDMLFEAFKLKVDARVIPHRPFSCPSIGGQALVICNSKDDVNFVISELKQKCLVVGEGRPPVVAIRRSLVEPDKSSSFPGHVVLESWLKRATKAKRVSNSHCAQSNTSEYEMATQWLMLQKRADLWWKALHEKQAEEISLCLNQLKSCQASEPTALYEAISEPAAAVEKRHSAPPLA